MFVTPCHKVEKRRVRQILRISRPRGRYEGPEAAKIGDQGLEDGDRAALEAPRRANARQLPHEEPKIEPADVHEHALEDVGMPTQILGSRGREI